jgi:hypothetical protein
MGACKIYGISTKKSLDYHVNTIYLYVTCISISAYAKIY